MNHGVERPRLRGPPNSLDTPAGQGPMGAVSERYLSVVNERTSRVGSSQSGRSEIKKAHRVAGAGSGTNTRTPMRSRLLVMLVALAALLVALWSAEATAQRTHVVREGQTLARIARRYGVSVADLLAANGMDRDDPLRAGMELRLPEEGIVYVRSGQTLSEIARAHGCSVEELRRINRLREGASLGVGDRIVLCGFEESARPRRGGASAETESRWGSPRSRGVASFYRISSHTKARVRLVDRRGHASRRGIRRLAELMRPADMRPGRSTPSPPSRLLEVMARISDHFGGRTIHIVSGYRTAGGSTRESSRHTRGAALDIRIAGVPNTAIRDYVRSSFERVGVGFYPRSRFVHVDVRDRSTYWVDWSRPGESPVYQRRGEAPPSDATDAERSAVGEGGDDVDEAEAGDAGEDAAAAGTEDAAEEPIDDAPAEE